MYQKNIEKIDIPKKYSKILKNGAIWFITSFVILELMIFLIVSETASEREAKFYSVG